MTAQSTIIANGTVFSVFQGAVERWPHHSVLFAPSEALGGAPAIAYSYAEAAGRVDAIKVRYATAGYGHGHRIGLALDNHPDFFLHFLALNALGASVAPINCAMRGAELEQIIGLADLSLIVTWPEHMDVIHAALTSLGSPAALVSAHSGQWPSAPPCADMEAGLPEGDREAAMIFTSGTTGRPKACILSNAYFTWIGAFYTGLGGYCVFRPGEDRILTPLPVTHMNALACSFMAAIMNGACLIQLDRFHASSWWRTVRETGATIIHYLGVMPAILLQRTEDHAGHKVRFGFGAGVDPRHHAAFEQRYGFPLIEAWAMSETGAAAWITANQEPRHVGMRCFGKAPPHLDIRLVDEEGADVPAGQPGELLVRAKGDDPRRYFFSGYYKDSAATAAAWEGGWFHTGDIVRRDEEGSLYFVDRNKNIIRRSGENIAATEVEGLLAQHPDIAHCAVLPVDDEMRGEEVMALIETRSKGGSADLARDIVEFCGRTLQYFKIPGYVGFVEALPTTASQKLQRGVIRKLGRELLAEGKAHDLRAMKRKGATAS